MLLYNRRTPILLLGHAEKITNCALHFYTNKVIASFIVLIQLPERKRGSIAEEGSCPKFKRKKTLIHSTCPHDLT